MIQVGRYQWEQGVPIPKCDSCNKNDAEYKVYTYMNGIRLCSNCLLELRSEVLRWNL